VHHPGGTSALERMPDGEIGGTVAFGARLHQQVGGEVWHGLSLSSESRQIPCSGNIETTLTDDLVVMTDHQN
jgi:hypothetical protein